MNNLCLHYSYRVVICPESPKTNHGNDIHTGEYQLHETMPYMAAAVSAIVSDCVSRSFTSEELRTWNMLSRYFCNILVL